MPPGDERDSDPQTLEDWLRPIREETMLWPVAGIAAFVATMIGAGVIVAATVLGSWASRGALLILVWMSYDIAKRNRGADGIGLIGRVVVGYWVSAAVLAAAGVALGLAR